MSFWDEEAVFSVKAWLFYCKYPHQFNSYYLHFIPYHTVPLHLSLWHSSWVQLYLTKETCWFGHIDSMPVSSQVSSNMVTLFENSKAARVFCRRKPQFCFILFIILRKSLGLGTNSCCLFFKTCCNQAQWSSSTSQTSQSGLS